MTRTHRILALFILWPIPFSSGAVGIAVGKPLPEVSIEAPRSGELVLNDDRIEYRSWKSSRLKGRARLIYHLAARMGINKINEDTVEEVAALELPDEEFLILSLLNIDDTLPGVGMFARKEFEKNRKIYPHPEFVVDNGSNAQSAWELSRKGSALIVVDKEGTVLFFKDGKVEPGERQRLLELLKKQVITGPE